MPSISFQPILDAALADYSKRLGIDLELPIPFDFDSAVQPMTSLSYSKTRPRNSKIFATEIPS
jgi:hypothetical protein